MVLGFVANLLTKLKWTKKLPESEVVILHRGAPNNKKGIKGNHITEIRKGSFSYVDHETKKESQIPMHRVLEIWMDEKLVWKKRVAKVASKTKKHRTKKVKSPKKKTIRKRTTKTARKKSRTGR